MPHPPQPEPVMTISTKIANGRTLSVEIQRIQADGEDLYLMASNTYRELQEAVKWAFLTIQIVADQEASGIPPIPADPDEDSNLLDSQLEEILNQTAE